MPPSQMSSQPRIPIQHKKPNSFASRIPDIEKLQARASEKITFSFLHFDRTKAEFNLGKTDAPWFVTLLDTMKELSELKWPEIQQKSIYDAHSYNKSANFRFPFDDLDQLECRQLRISKSEGRIHGILLGSIFFIVWLDPHHNMCDSVGYPGVQYFSAPQTPYEKLKTELAETKQELETYKENIRIMKSICPDCAV